MAEEKKIYVIGAGLIGASWTAIFVFHGWSVHVVDPAPDADRKVRDAVSAALTALRLISPDSKNAIGDITVSSDLPADMSDAAWVQENGPEDINWKRRILADIDQRTAPDVVIASSTSSLMASDMQVDCRRPERVLVAHPFNPPHLIPLVEIVPGARTAAWAVDAAVDFCHRLGKKPIRVKKEVPGHIANRLTSAVCREAVHMVAEGIADVADIDTAMAYGPGLRWAIMGPYMTYHLGGGEGGIAHYLEHLGASQEERWKHLGSTPLTEEVRQRIIEGVYQEAGERTLPELVAERDRCLIDLLKILATNRD